MMGGKKTPPKTSVCSFQAALNPGCYTYPTDIYKTLAMSQTL